MRISMLSVAYSEVKPQHSAGNSQGGCWSAPVLSNVSFFGNYYLVYDVCSSNDFFIYFFRWKNGVDGELWRPTTCSTWTSMSGIFCAFSFESSVISSQENLIDLFLLEESVFVNSLFFSASGNNQKDAAYMNHIKSISPSRISIENLVVITQVSWNAINISNRKSVFINSLFFI